MKKSELIFSALLVPVDWIMLILAGIFAYAIRFNQSITEIRPIIFELPFADYFQIIIIVATFWIIIFALSGLYLIKARRSVVRETLDVALTCSAGLLLVILYIFWQREFFSSRFIVLTAYLSAILFVSIGRAVVRLIQRRLYKRGIGLHSVLLIGNSEIGEQIKFEYTRNIALGYIVLHHIINPKSSIIDDIKHIVKEHYIDDILYIDNQMLSSQTVSNLVHWSSLQNITFHFSSDYLQLPRAGVDIVSVAGIPIMEFKKTTIDGWGRIFKRTFDIIFSILFILISCIPMLFISALIKSSSKGTVLFAKLDDGKILTRIGLHGKPFRYFKFRTMLSNSNSMRYSRELDEKNIRKDSPLVKIKDDPRITKTGEWLRRFSLDELPELFLVLIGKMSLVGPRPHLPEEVAKYKNHHKVVFTIKPGITGLSQISGRSDIDFEDEIKFDTYYIQNWSLILDIQIIIKTIPAILRRREVI